MIELNPRRSVDTLQKTQSAEKTEKTEAAEKPSTEGEAKAEEKGAEKESKPNKPSLAQVFRPTSLFEASAPKFEASTQKPAAAAATSSTTATSSKSSGPTSGAELAEEHAKMFIDSKEMAPEMKGQICFNLLIGQQNDTAYQQHFLGRMKKAGILESLGGAQELSAKDPSALKARQDLAKMLDGARSRGQLTDDDIRACGQGHHAGEWRLIADQMKPPVRGVALSPAALKAATEAETARTELETARGRINTLNATLSDQLAELGPGLTDTQRQQYLQQYHELHKADYAKEVELAKALETKLANPALGDAALNSPKIAGQINEAYSLLAQTPSARASLDWAAKVHDDPLLKAAYQKTIPNFTRQVQDRIISPGLSNAVSQTLVVSGGDLEKTRTELKTLTDHLRNVRDLKDSPANLDGAWKALNEVLDGKYDGVRALAKGYEEMSPLARSAASVVVMLGAISAVEKGKEGQYTAMLKEVAGATRSAAELIAGATMSLANSGKLARFGVNSSHALSVAKWAERFGPGLGILANGAAFVAHAQEAKDKKSAALAFAAFGDAIATFGEVVSLTPVAPLGKIFSVVGTGISIIGETLAYIGQRGEYHDEQRKVLSKLKPPLSNATIDGLIEGQLDILAKRGSLTPQEVQAFVAKNPDTSEERGSLDALLTASEQFGMYGKNFQDFIERLAKDSDRNVHDLSRQLMSVLGNKGDARDVRLFIESNFPETVKWAQQRQRETPR